MRLLDQRQGVLRALPAAHLRPLRLLERLVRAEEMRDLPQHVFGNVTQRVHFGVVRIFCAAYRVHMRLSGSATETALVRHVRYLPDSEHLLVHALLILHDHVSTAQMGIFLTQHKPVAPEALTLAGCRLSCLVPERTPP